MERVQPNRRAPCGAGAFARRPLGYLESTGGRGIPGNDGLQVNVTILSTTRSTRGDRMSAVVSQKAVWELLVSDGIEFDQGWKRIPQTEKDRAVLAALLRA